MALTIIALCLSLIAITINLTGLLRRPRIAAEWGTIYGDPRHETLEGMSVIVTARRRPIEVDQVGVVFMPPTWRRRIPEWRRQDYPVRLPLESGDTPKRLEDGQSVRAGYVEDSLLEKMAARGVLGQHSYIYVLASGTVYLACERKAIRRLRDAAARLPLNRRTDDYR